MVFVWMREQTLERYVDNSPGVGGQLLAVPREVTLPGRNQGSRDVKLRCHLRIKPFTETLMFSQKHKIELQLGFFVFE